MKTPVIGILEWFRPGEYRQVERVLADLKTLTVQELRTGFSWADWHTAEGREWYRWLMPRLAHQVKVLPCFHYTPPGISVAAKTSAPPRNLKDFADFLDEVITEFGQYFEWVELWNEPNNLNDWDWRLDVNWQIFCEMIGCAAYWAQHRGKKTVLGGLAPVDANLLSVFCDRGLIQYFDAIGIHGFPGTWEFDWQDWSRQVDLVREVLQRYNLSPEVWITETGFSTWKHDEYGQLQAFIRAIDAPVDRLYWYAAYDLHPDLPTQDGLHSDVRHYFMGLKRSDGDAKLLYRLWANGGLEAVRGMTRLEIKPIKTASPVLITGGAGFIGTNLAFRLLRQGESVLLFDNLSHPGAEENWRWLRSQFGELVSLQLADVRSRHTLRQALSEAKQVFHLAAQTGADESFSRPIADFEANALGTLNLLEELRLLASPPPLIFASSSKVYGLLPNLVVEPNCTRYQPVGMRFDINEDYPLSFHSPYGCSKGAADQYVLDYAQSFRLSAVVLRLGSVYGSHQLSNEQDWMTQSIRRVIAGQSVTLYGDGLQVQDMLFVEDLVDALLLATQHIDQLSGQAFNLGGGKENTISPLEFVDLIDEIRGEKTSIYFEKWHQKEPLYYVSDFTKFQAITNWQPTVDINQGIRKLYEICLSQPELDV